MKSLRVIINADDLGCSDIVNKNIFLLMDKKKVSSATLMANGPNFLDAIKQIPKFKKFSFGAHLNLTEFKAETTPQIFYDMNIIDENGVFTGIIRQANPSYSLLRAIMVEFEKQLMKILDNDVPITHLDSHHHIHTIPWLFFILKKLQIKFKIRKARISMNLYNLKECSPTCKLLLEKKIWNWALRNLYLTKTSDYFTEFRWFLDIINSSKIDLSSTVELMCHPGQPYSKQDTQLLFSDWIKKVPFSIDQISYREI